METDKPQFQRRRQQRLTFSQLLDTIAPTHVVGDTSAEVPEISYDSREVVPGALFVAIPGGYVDGHEFLSDALARGAISALVERETPALSGFRTWAVVENTRASLAPIAAALYGRPGDALGVIGVTGTDGKTTTSYLIDALLRYAGNVTGMVGTVSVRIADQVVDHDTRQTTPESLDVQRLLAEMRDAGVDWAVLEATSHALSLFRLNECPFDIGVVTNVTREHLDFHDTVEAYRQAKSRLLQRVRDRSDRPYPRGVVLNADDDGARAIAPERGDSPTLWYGLERSDTDLYADSIEPHSSGTRFRLSDGERSVPVALNLIGRFNVQNALAAAGAGVLIGLSLDEIADGLASLREVPGRLHRIDCGQPFAVYVDYAHSPASISQVLKLVRAVTPGQIIAVSGSAGERDRGKRPVQGRISAELADLSIFTSEDPRFEDPDLIVSEIAAGALDAGAKPNENFFEIEDRRRAIETAMSLARSGDAVVLAGKGHEQCMIYASERRPWDEAEEARRALQALGYPCATSAKEGSS